MFLAFTLVPEALARKPASPLTDWADGPVRYLITTEESRLWHRLRTDEEREDFVRRFWARRDPTTGTPQNELRAAFWTRVAEANRQFGDQAKPGWKTDRGKIFILLGPPDDIDRNERYDTGDRTSSQPGLLRWEYRGLGALADRPVTIVAFTREAGDWQLSTDQRLTAVSFNILASPTENRLAAYDRLIATMPLAGSNLGTYMDLGRLQEVPTEHDLMQAAISAEQFVGTLEGAVETHTLGSATDGVSVAITVAVRQVDLTPPWDGSATQLAQRFSVSAQFKPVAPTAGVLVDAAEETFQAEPTPSSGDAWLRFQSVRVVPAGRWELTAVVLDRLGGGAAHVRSTLDIAPDAPGAPRFIGPVLATEVLETTADAPPNTPFRVRDLIVVPRLDTVLTADQTFHLLVEVRPPTGEVGPVALDWTVEHADSATAPFTPFRQPGHLDDARGPRHWVWPAKDLPAGRFRITFHSTTPAGPTAERSVEFEVRAR